MTNIKKISADFESFDSFFAGLSMKEEKNAIKLYEKYIQSFLASKITQAEQEMIKRVVGEIDIAWKKVWDYPITNVKEMFDKRERSFNEGRNFGADKFKANLLSSLNKPTE